MRKLYLIVFWIFVSALFGDALANSETILPQAKQLVVVTTSGWDSVPGKLWLLQRSGDSWARISSWPIVVGRKGLAWEKNIHSIEKVDAPKKEGDGKSPAGVFSLSSAFGLEPVEKMKDVKLPYLPLSSVIECVDDARSTNYNLIVNRTQFPRPDWESSEKMSEFKKEYRLGVVVDHNTNPRTQGDGSCIFLHIWKNEQTGTAGCTAMEGSKMEKLILWLDAEKNPALIQMPQAEYERFAPRWKLPKLK